MNTVSSDMHELLNTVSSDMHELFQSSGNCLNGRRLFECDEVICGLQQVIATRLHRKALSKKLSACQLSFLNIVMWNLALWRVTLVSLEHDGPHVQYYVDMHFPPNLVTCCWNLQHAGCDEGNAQAEKKSCVQRVVQKNQQKLYVCVCVCKCLHACACVCMYDCAWVCCV